MLYIRRKVCWRAFFRYLSIRKMFSHARIIFGNYLHSFKKVVTLFFWVKLFTMVTKIVLLRKRMTSIILRIMTRHFFRSLSMISCIPLSIVWWMWSRSVSSYHLTNSKQSRLTLEFSWSNKGFKCQKVLKGLETNKQSFPDRNNLQKKRYNPESIFEWTNHNLRTF